MTQLPTPENHFDEHAIELIACLPTEKMRKLAIKVFHGFSTILDKTKILIMCFYNHNKYQVIHSAAGSQVESVMSILETNVPITIREQVSYLQSVEERLSEFDVADCTEDEDLYDMNILPCIVKRLASPEMTKKMSFFQELYKVVQHKSSQQRELMISWLQPPPQVMSCIDIGMYSMVFEMYKELLATASREDFSEDVLHRICANSDMAKKLHKQVIVPCLCCSVSEMCEFVWRSAKNSFTGIYFKENKNKILDEQQINMSFRYLFDVLLRTFHR